MFRVPPRRGRRGGGRLTAPFVGRTRPTCVFPTPRPAVVLPAGVPRARRASFPRLVRRSFSARGRTTCPTCVLPAPRPAVVLPAGVPRRFAGAPSGAVRTSARRPSGRSIAVSFPASSVGAERTWPRPASGRSIAVSFPASSVGPRSGPGRGRLPGRSIAVSFPASRPSEQVRTPREPAAPAALRRLTVDAHPCGRGGSPRAAIYFNPILRMPIGKTASRAVPGRRCACPRGRARAACRVRRNRGNRGRETAPRGRSFGRGAGRRARVRAARPSAGAEGEGSMPKRESTW